MRKVVSVSFHVIAGIFLSMMNFTGFVNQQDQGLKLAIMILFLIPAILALCFGVAIQIQNWKRDIGVVLLSASGCAAFIVATLAGMLLSEDFRQLMPGTSSDPMSDYVAGIALRKLCITPHEMC